MEEYIKNLLNISALTPKVNKQILSYRNDYLDMSPVEFYKEGIKRGEKLINLFEEKK